MKRLAAALFSLANLQAPQGSRSESPPPAHVRMEAASVEALRRDPRKLTPSRLPGPPAKARPIDDPGPLPAGMPEAVAAIRVRDYPRALAALYRVLDGQADYPPALYEMGIVYFRLQRYGDGAVALERFLAVAPEAIGKTRALGHCYYSLGDYARARSHYERVLAAAPGETEAWRGLALSQMHLGDSKSALESLDRALQIEPAHAEAWAWKAEILFDAERSSDALAAAEKSRDLDRWQPRPWYLLGRILLDLGREKEGSAAQARYRELAAVAEEVRSIESRLEYGPHDVPSLARLVELHRSTGNAPAARLALARLVAERPDDTALRIFALDVLEGLGDTEGARAEAMAMKQSCARDWKAWRRLEQYFGRTGERMEEMLAGEKARRLRSE